MKKIVIGILAFLYLSFSSGMTVTLHYCMGKLIDSGLVDHQSKKCSRCGMDKKTAAEKGCCSDEQKLVKIENDQKEAESFYKILPVPVAITSFNQLRTGIQDLVVANTKNYSTNSLFRSKGIETYILNCDFRL